MKTGVLMRAAVARVLVALVALVATLPLVSEARAAATQATSAPVETHIELNAAQLDALSLEALLQVQVSIATKQNHPVAAAPAAVTVITENEIRRLGIASLEELLHYVVGFYPAMNSNSMTPFIGVRGTRANDRSNVLVILDGEVLNDAFAGSAIGFQTPIDLENIAYVEIMKGPASAIYGSNAFLATINLTTRPAANSITLLAGSTGRRKVAASVSRTVDDFQASAFARIIADDGERFVGLEDIYEHAPIRDALSTVEGRGRLAYRDLALQVRYVDVRSEGAPLFRIAGGENRVRWRRTSARLSYGTSWLNGRLNLQTHAGASVDEVNSVGIVALPGMPAAPGVVLTQVFLTGPYARTIRGNTGLEVVTKLLPDNVLVGGAVYEYTGVPEHYLQTNYHPITFEPLPSLSTRALEPAFRWSKPNARRHMVSAYVHDTMDVGDWLQLTAGLRADYYDDVGLVLSPRAAAVAQVVRDGYLRLTYGHAFRAPNFLDLYTRNNPIVFGNPDLDPVRIHSWELGYEQRLATGLSASLAAYYNRVHDTIVLGDDRPQVTHNPFAARQVTNRGSYSANGLEVEVKAEPLKSLLVIANYGFSPERSVYFPTHSASARLAYEWSAWGFSLHGFLRDGKNLFVHGDQCAIANASVRYSMSEHMLVRGTVEDLVGTRCATNAAVGRNPRIPNRGRTFLLGLMAE